MLKYAVHNNFGYQYQIRFVHQILLFKVKTIKLSVKN